MLKALRARHPGRRIGLVCREKLGDFFLKTGLVDELFEIRKGDRRSYKDLVARLRGRALAAVYSPHSSIRTALFVWSLNVDETVGFRKKWNAWAFKRRIARPDLLPDVLRQMSLLSPEDPELAARLRAYEKENSAYTRGEGGRLSPVPEWASIGLRDRLTSDAAAWRDLKTKLGLTEEPLVLIFPGSVWATKRWTPEGFIEVARSFDGHQVLFMGAGNEIALAESLAREVPGSRSLAGKTDLFESAMILARAKLMIGNDSASIHLASAAGTPLVTIFGPTVIEQGFRPWSSSAYLVEKKALECRPCGPHGHHRCPRRTHECMKSLPADDVLKAVAAATHRP